MPRRRLRVVLIPPLASTFIRATWLTMRIRHAGRELLEGARRGGRPYIHAFWHGHLFLMPYSYRGRGISILISAHDDGEIIARTMARFGHQSIRGSTTHGGASALRAAVRALREGRDVGFTPDGPRGPRHQAQMGVIQAARLSGAPIVPVVFAASRGWTLRSWDRFLVPCPFSRGLFLYGEPLTVADGAGPDQMERARLDLETRMNAMAAKAEEMVKGPLPAAGSPGERHA